MDTKEKVCIVKLLNYLKPIIKCVDENCLWITNPDDGQLQEEYLPCILQFIEEAWDATKEIDDFLRIINDNGWWKKCILEDCIPRMREQDILICLKGIVYREKKVKGYILEYLQNGIIIKLLQRLKEICKPFYEMTWDELNSVKPNNWGSVDCELCAIALLRMMENQFPQTDVAYEEYCCFYGDDKVQERINKYYAMTLTELEKLTYIRRIFTYDERTGMAIFDKIRDNPDELAKFDISEMTDKEFKVFFECYKKVLLIKYGSR